MFRPHVVGSICARNFTQYFTSVLGYLFIFVFVTLCALLTFSPQFFVDNLANVDHLTRYYPFLLLFLIPAITMTVWSDEMRQGTDALLFTLPASDTEILAGKYLAVAGVYTVALLFSCTQLISLASLGSPDWGVIAATWLGYWLAGMAMLAIGMFASSLTSSATVAFVIGALLCAVPVMIGYLFAGNQLVESFGVGPQLHEFSLGQVPLSGVVYFVSIAALMLYLNLVVISKRHWSRGKSVTLASHFVARVAALAVGLVALNIVIDRTSASFPARLDLTAEGLYSLDESTRDTIEAAADAGRPVTIQAFVSPQVPARYVSARKRLLGLLRQYERLGQGNIDVRVVDVRPNSESVDEARSLGIVPQPTREEVAGKSVEQDVYMGAIVTSSLDEVVLPFIDGDTSIEYELTRSIATTTVESRKLRIGVLKTDAHFNNLEAQGREFDWSFARTVQELEKQYELATIDPAILPKVKSTRLNPPGKSQSGTARDGDAENVADAGATDDPAEKTDDSKTPVIDVLIVADPSSLSFEGLAHLVAWVQAGNPTLILADPIPFYWYVYQAPRELGIINAPSSPRIKPTAPWAPVSSVHRPRTPFDQSPPIAEPRPDDGRCTDLLNVLGIAWRHDRVVWTVNNPHLSFKPQFPERLGQRWPANYGPREAALMFARDTGDFAVFNRNEDISAGLQEVLFSYAGSVAPVQGATTTFTPLVTLKPGTAGQFDWNEITVDLVGTYTEFDQFTGQAREVTGPVPSDYTGNTIRVLKNPSRASASSADGESKEPGDTTAAEFKSRLTDRPYVLAARITSGESNDASPDENQDRPSGVDVVFVADADFASDLVFEQQPALDSPLDNFTFLVNAIETLAGDRNLVRLRNRRASSRTLTAIEKLTEQYRIEAAAEQEKVNADIDRKIAEAQAKLEEKASQISENQEMSVWQKIQEAGLSAASEQRKLDRFREKMEREREQSLDAIAVKRQKQIDRVESVIRRLSILSAGLPALLLGVVVLVIRVTRERRHMDPGRKIPRAA